MCNFYLFTDRIKVSVNMLEPSLQKRGNALKHAVFTDLWEKKYYITNGSKFGCDFLVYPGNSIYIISWY